MPYAAEPAYQHGAVAKTGILLANLGTPDAPTAAALRPYLKQFLSDPRVVEIPRWIWWFILNGIILNSRPRRSAEKYAKIWTPEGSPLAVHTQRQARLLRGYLSERTRAPIAVEWAMRYGKPAIAQAMHALRNQDCDRILVIPLYPQYAASSTGSTFDAVQAAAVRMRNVPGLRLVKHFHDDPGYIRALAQGIKDYWSVNGRPDKLVMSFHGVPRYTLDKGDPYHCECQKTGRLLGEALQLEPEQYLVTFQSRFGSAEWLKPYTLETVTAFGRKKLGRVDVVCPGFVSDCLETLEEIAIENKAAFLGAGGREFHYLPCLNEGDAWIRALADIAMRNLQGWIDGAPDTAQTEGEASSSQRRALALGASR
jgi:protoporphyrin/coproporphyrin ferrochelatase